MLDRLNWAAALHLLPPEPAHRLTVRLLGAGLLLGSAPPDPPELGQQVWGLRFANPVGLAAGFDKDGEALAGLARLGFGSIEIGSVTPRAQPGNPRPRLFRLPEDEAVVNRMGFNSAGSERVAERVRRWRERRDRSGPLLGVNLGKNRESEDAGADYAAGVAVFAGLADYLVVNVSSPNTPGVRALQQRDALAALMERVLTARRGAIAAPPLLLKVAPDLSADERYQVAEVALAAGVDGLVVGNTTVSRPPGLRNARRSEAGGLSGRPLFPLSTEALADFHRLTHGRLPLVGVGGIASGHDAYLKIRAGASLVQLYTALVYQGPALIGRIKRELVQFLARDGFHSVAEAVGADHR